MLRLRPGASIVAGPRRLSRCKISVRNNSTEVNKQPPLSKPFDGAPAPQIPPKRTGVARPVVLTTAAALAVGGAGLLSYSFYDQRFRRDVEINVPFMSDVFSAVFSSLGLEPDRQQHGKAASSAATVGAGQVVKRDPVPFLPIAEQKAAAKKPAPEGEKSAPQNAAEEVADRLSAAPVPPAAEDAPSLFQAAGAVAQGIAGTAEKPSGSSSESDSAARASEGATPQPASSEVKVAAPKDGSVLAHHAAVGHTEEQQAPPAAQDSAATAAASPVVNAAAPSADKSSKTDEEEVYKAQAKRVLEASLTKQLEEARSTTLEALRLLHLVDDAATTAQFVHLGKDDSAEAAELLKSRQSASNEAKRAAEEAEESLRSLQRTIDSVKAAASSELPSPLLDSAQHSTSQMAKDLQAAVAQVAKAERQSAVMAEYVEKLEKGQPAVAAGQQDGGASAATRAAGARLTEEELNALIALAHRRIDELRRQLLEQQQQERLNVEAAIAEQLRADEQRTSELIDRELGRQRAKFEVEKRQWDAEAREAAEREIRAQLTRQAAAHSDHLAEVLRVQRDDLRRRFERELQQHAIAERNLVVAELGQHLATARGVEAALAVRANLEERVQQMQRLLLASQSLAGAIHAGKGGAAWEDRLCPLAAEVEALQSAAAAGADEFVGRLLSALPELAVARGVWTEASLRKRFDRVRRSCEHVALLDDDGEPEPSLVKYFVAYVQSLLVVRRPARLVDEEDELSAEERLDTHALLAHAAHFVAAGNLEQAVRYVSQLKGVPRRVAGDWLAEARLLLEARQVASAIGAFVDARRLGSVF